MTRTPRTGVDTAATRVVTGRQIDLRAPLAVRLQNRFGIVSRSVDELLRHSAPSPQRIHRLHSELRRLRVEWRLWRGTLGRATAERSRVLDRRLEETARRVGEVRDSDVQLELLETFRSTISDPPGRRHAAALLRRFKDDAHIGRELLRAYLQAEQEAGLFRDIAASWQPRRGRPPRPVLPDDLAGAFQRERSGLERAFHRARRRPSPGRCHQLRIRLRRTRYLAEMLAMVTHARTPPYPRRLVSLQATLGRLHDLDLRSEWAERFPLHRPGRPEDAESEERRMNRKRLRSELRSRTTLAAIRSLEAD